MIFCHERKYFSTPLGSTFVLVRPRLTYVTPLMAIAGMTGAVGGCQPAPTKPPV